MYFYFNTLISEQEKLFHSMKSRISLKRKIQLVKSELYLRRVWIAETWQNMGCASRADGSAGQLHPAVECIPMNLLQWELPFTWQTWVAPYPKLQAKHCSPFSPSHFTTLPTALWSYFTTSLFYPPSGRAQKHFTLSWHKSLRNGIYFLHPLFLDTRWSLASWVLTMTIKYTQDKINKPSVSYTQKSTGQVSISKTFCCILEAQKFLLTT